MFLASCSLTIVDGGRVAFWFAPGHPLPHVCLSQRWLGLNCPGCGLTRSLIALLQGDWSRAWQMHRLGWLVLAILTTEVPLRIAALCSPNFNRRFPWQAGLYLYGGLLGLLVGNWLAG